jgi:diguanylate cyclase (GGDEF)-like protein/PAS domain S-box-containing protein
VSPKALAYLIGPVALVAILVLMRFGLVAHEAPWLWIAVFAVIPAASLVADRLYERRRTTVSFHLLVAQNAAWVTIVIYLSGWGPVLGLSFAFIALESISRGGSRLWRVALVWSLLGIAAGQAAVWVKWAPSVLSTSKANTLAFLGAFMLLFVIRMAGAVMRQKENAESTLSLSEERFRSLISNTLDATLVISDDGLFTYVSPSVTRLLGYEPSELVGKRANDFSHPEDQDIVRDHFHDEENLKAGSALLQFRMVRKDGTVCDVEAGVVDMRQNPSVGGFVANVRDITERNAAARELRRSEESFQSLFAHHPHPMYVYDVETLRFLEVNQCATENYGYTRDEFLAMNITQIRPEEEVLPLTDYLRIVSPNLTHAGVWRHRTKQGEIMEVEITRHALEFRGRRGALVMAQDVTERRRLEQQLREHALHDSLTGLPNRSLLVDRVSQLKVQAKRSNADAMVICLNLDNFKLTNEAYGHDVGDGLIRAVGDRLVGALREADTVGRSGGDEFVILAVPPMVEAQPALMGKKMLDLVSCEPFYIDGHELRLTASIGIVAGGGDEGGDLIQSAALAMSLAKADGGNRYVVFAQEMQSAEDERITLTLELRGAARADQFETFYQPVVKLKNLGVVGVEALVRWRHPRLGLVSPARFIPLAEETGMIGDIGRIVLRQACDQAALLQKQQNGLTVAVNVSAVQLRSDEFVTDVADALERSHLSPKCLVLEVTESMLIDDAGTALKRLTDLKKLGVRLSLDDFGTGYSSLNYLRQFPFDILKIDQTFIASMVGSPQAVTMVRTMIQLGRQLKLDVVAEGVETQEQLDILRGLHCQHLQGYLFARPMGAEVIGAFLSEWSTGRAAERRGGSPSECRGSSLLTSPVTPDCTDFDTQLVGHFESRSS